MAPAHSRLPLPSLLWVLFNIHIYKVEETADLFFFFFSLLLKAAWTTYLNTEVRRAKCATLSPSIYTFPHCSAGFTEGINHRKCCCLQSKPVSVNYCHLTPIWQTASMSAHIIIILQRPLSFTGSSKAVDETLWETKAFHCHCGTFQFTTHLLYTDSIITAGSWKWLFLLYYNTEIFKGKGHVIRCWCFSFLFFFSSGKDQMSQWCTCSFSQFMWLRIGRSKNKEEKSSQPRSVKKKKRVCDWRAEIRNLNYCIDKLLFYYLVRYHSLYYIVIKKFLKYYGNLTPKAQEAQPEGERPQSVLRIDKWAARHGRHL